LGEVSSTAAASIFIPGEGPRRQRQAYLFRAKALDGSGELIFFGRRPSTAAASLFISGEGPRRQQRAYLFRAKALDGSGELSFLRFLGFTTVNLWLPFADQCKTGRSRKPYLLMSKDSSACQSL
jgi:hypothetical protein